MCEYNGWENPFFTTTESGQSQREDEQSQIATGTQGILPTCGRLIVIDEIMRCNWAKP